MIPILYKYCRFTKDNYDIKNLEADALYLNPPTTYNDPYEGVVANNIVDVFEAFLAALAMEKSENPEAILTAVRQEFRFLEMLLDADASQNMSEVQKHFQDFIGMVIKKARCPEIQLVAMELWCSNCYMQNIIAIKNFSLPIDTYALVLKEALSENPRLTTAEREKYYIPILNDYKQKYLFVNKYRERTNLLVPIYLVDAVHNMMCTCYKKENTYEETLIECNAMAKEMFGEIRKMPGKFFLTTCLSETSSSILMWSHYADKHTGFCIEYDFNLLPKEEMYLLEYLKKVAYKDRFPKLQQTSLVQVVRKRANPSFEADPSITQATADVCMEAIVTKNSAWCYEKEWRLVFPKENEGHQQKIPCATKIILGVDILDSNRALLLSLAKEKGLPVFQAYLVPERCEIKSYQIQ